MDHGEWFFVFSSWFKATILKCTALNFSSSLFHVDYHFFASQLGMQFAYGEIRSGKDFVKKMLKNIAGFFSKSKSPNDDTQKCSLLVANAKNIDCL